jgi:hypothetical protein
MKKVVLEKAFKEKAISAVPALLLVRVIGGKLAAIVVIGDAVAVAPVQLVSRVGGGKLAAAVVLVVAAS